MKLMKIFLLEDNPTDAGLTIRSLKKAWAKCVITHTTTLQQAREVLEDKAEFDIALLDMQLPDGNGLDILMEIRQEKKDIAVAMLTGSGDEEVAVAALKAGADDYRVKQPGYIDKLPRTVEFAIENFKEAKQKISGVISLLHVEHNPADVDLTHRHFTRYAPYIKVKDAPKAESALELLSGENTKPGKKTFDVILMDYQLPGISALEFIKTVRVDWQLDIPIIVVTGQGNEEVAVQTLKLGASEYLVKRENYLTRLPSLITSVFQHNQLIRQQKALAKSEAQYRLLAENSGDVIFTLDFDLNYTYISPAIYSLRGFKPEEIIHRKITETLTPDSLDKVKQIYSKLLPAIKNGNTSVEPMIVELESYKKDGSTIWVEIKVSVATDEKGIPNGILGVSRDISKRKAAQEELRKLSRAVYQSPVSISITGVSGEIEYVNPQFTKLTGYTSDEVIGKNSRILKSGKQKHSFYKKLWQTILSGKNWQGELQNKKKTGEFYWAYASISPLHNDEGNITHFVAVKEDVTERKKMEKIHQVLKNISDAVASNRSLGDFFNLIYTELTSVINTKNIFIALYDKQKKIFSTVFMHDTQDEEIVDYPADKTLSNFLLKTRKSQFIDKKTLNQLIEKGEIELVGPMPEVWVGVLLLEQDEAIGVMVIQNYEGEKNLTKEDLKLLEFAGPAISVAIERKKFIENLKIEKEKAQAADRLKTAFLNNISHEVRTPLNGILGFGQMMTETDLTQEAKEMYLKILNQSGNRLINTITDFMDISLITSGNVTVKKKKIPIYPLLNELVELYKNQCKEKDLEFNLDLPQGIENVELELDAELLKKVFKHLLNNALKFTNKGTVSLGCELKKDAIECFVKDTGIGIENEMQQEVFSHFTQEDSRIERGYEGSGLGLSIAKGIVELLGGEIGLKSEKGKGTIVGFSFPLSPEQIDHEKPGNIHNPAGGNIVLIAEDDEVNRLYLETILKGAGIQFVSVEDGQQAVEMCLENSEIGIVLMDLKMPVMDGYEATRQIKILKQELPIIAITAQAMQGDREKALHAGCDDYVTKPFNKNDLLVKVELGLYM